MILFSGAQKRAERDLDPTVEPDPDNAGGGKLINEKPS